MTKPLFGMEEIREVYPRSESTILKLYYTAGFPMAKNANRWETTREAVHEWIAARAANVEPDAGNRPKKNNVKPKKW